MNEYWKKDNRDESEVEEFSRWISSDLRVWEKRKWGWKFIGVAKSQTPIHIEELVSNDCDHPNDIVREEM